MRMCVSLIWHQPRVHDVSIDGLCPCVVLSLYPLSQPRDERRAEQHPRLALSVVLSLYTGAPEPRAARTKPKVGAADLLRTDLLRHR